MPEPDDSPPTQVVELVVNLDDVTGEQLGLVIDRLMQRGALDAWVTPITMKKGRPATMLSVLAAANDQPALTDALLRLTSSFGVRYRAWDRLVLDRSWHERQTRLGHIKLKAGALAGETITVKPEFDDVVRLAEAAGVGVAEAHQAAQAAADALRAELNAATNGGGAG